MADSHTYTDEYRRECADLVIASGRPAAQMADEFVESRYNRKRPHSTIGYRIPAEVMDGFFERTDPMPETARNQPSVKLEKTA